MRLLFSLLVLIVFASGAASAQTPGVVYKSPTCGCCEKWVNHMQQAGFSLAPKDMGTSQLMRQKLKLGIAAPQASCHTAEIGGYVIEGHVPADDVRRLLAERPDAVGLAVPDMPSGSPGMEAGDVKEPFDVLLVKRDGSTEVFAKHGRP
jgi:hypothetical protein